MPANLKRGALTAISSQPAPIDTDLPCSSCGYNLRGLQSDGKCPECAGSIATSIEVHRRGIPRQLLSRTLLSVRRMLAGFAVVFVGGIAPKWYDRHDDTWWGTLLVFVILTGWVWAASAVGVLIFAEPTPRRILPQWLRWLTATTAAVSLAAPLLVLFNEAVGGIQALRDVATLLLLASLVATWGYFDLLRRVARILEARALAILLRVVSWGMPVATVMMCWLVWSSMSRMSTLLFVAIAPIPGIGFTSTVMLIVWQIVVSLEFSDQMFIWMPVPVFSLASVVALIWMHKASRRRLASSGGEGRAAPSAPT